MSRPQNIATSMPGGLASPSATQVDAAPRRGRGGWAYRRWGAPLVLVAIIVVVTVLASPTQSG